jgi:density-regulated protein DRP1
LCTLQFIFCLLLYLIIPKSSLDAQTSSAVPLSEAAASRASKDASKKASKAAAAASRESARLASSTVTIKLVERSKRKHVTVIGGLEAFIGPDGVKKAAKELGKKFAAGASVTKNATGGDEVVVQGDVAGEVEEWIEERYEGVVPEGSVEIIEGKGGGTGGGKKG